MNDTVLPKDPWPIPGSVCAHCREPLAWRRGVARPVVLTHLNGEDRCAAPLASLRDDDRRAAQAVLDDMAARLDADTKETNA